MRLLIVVLSIALFSNAPSFGQTANASGNTDSDTQAKQGGVQPYVKGEFLLRLRAPMAGKYANQVFAQNYFRHKSQKYRSLQVLHSFDDLQMHHMKIDENEKSVEGLINEMNGDSEVLYAEPNYIVKKAAEASGYSAEAYYTLNQVLSFNGVMTTAQIDNSQAWSAMKAGAPPTVVAVIDTGIDFTHPAFQNTLWTNKGEIPGNGIDDDANGYVDDYNGWNFAYGNNNPSDDEGHGTHVSGIVLGVGQNIFASTVPLQNTEIMPLKFLDSTGSGSNANAIAAIYYAANMGAKVMNNSWGGGSYSQALVDAIGYAYSRDSVFVAAAGNSSTNNDTTPSYPASYNATNEISVAASDSSDVLASFSNFGGATVPLTAPGVAILSTYPVGQYAQMSGTSMASPMVAGTVALMRNQRPQMNSYQIKQLVISSVDVKSNLAGQVASSGRVNVENAVVAAQNTALSSYLPPFTAAAGSGGGTNQTMSCGLVSIVGKGMFKKNDTAGNAKQMVVLLAILLMPVLLALALRRPTPAAAQRRRFERYAIDSAVSFRLGDRTLSGSVKSISMGGSDLNTDALLKDGSVISMVISSPDGQSKIEVQGHVVWSEQNKRYGVAFDEVNEAIKAQIGQWTKALPKAS
jgi:subtilisin family serine protease